MAKPISNTNNNSSKQRVYYKEEKTERNTELEQLKKLNEEKDKEIAELSKNMLNMQQQLNELMQKMMSKTNDLPNHTEEVVVGNRSIYGSLLATNDDKIHITFNCNEEKAVDVEDLKTLFKEGIRDNRLLFEEDTLYFKDPANYARFKIKKKVDLSEENIVRILMLPSHDMIDEINKLTNSLTNFRITHALQFEIVKLLISKDKPLNNWSYDNRNTLENYIGQKFDNLMAAVGAVELLGRQSFKNL